MSFYWQKRIEKTHFVDFSNTKLRFDVEIYLFGLCKKLKFTKVGDNLGWFGRTRLSKAIQTQSRVKLYTKMVSSMVPLLSALDLSTWLAISTSRPSLPSTNDFLPFPVLLPRPSSPLQGNFLLFLFWFGITLFKNDEALCDDLIVYHFVGSCQPRFTSSSISSTRSLSFPEPPEPIKLWRSYS